MESGSRLFGEPGYRVQNRIKVLFIKDCNIFIFRPVRRTSKLHKKTPAVQREHTALQHMKFHYFFVGHFARLDPDPDFQSNSRPESTKLTESGSETLGTGEVPVIHVFLF